MSDHISRQAALDCVTYDVEYTTERIKALPSLQPTCNQLATDCVSRQDAIDALNKEIIKRRLLDDVNDGMLDEFDTEDILRKLPSVQPGINCSEFPNTSDFVSRKAVRDMVATWLYDMAEWEDMELALSDVDELQSVQQELNIMNGLIMCPKTECKNNNGKYKCTSKEVKLEQRSEKSVYGDRIDMVICKDYKPENQLKQSAQPEVIHCKDCALWHRVGCPMNVFVEKPEPGYFCGTAKRKEK